LALASQKKGYNFVTKSAQKFFFATMRKKRQQMLKNVTFTEKRDFLSRKKLLVSFLHS
jgi:hypothetical protein